MNTNTTTTKMSKAERKALRAKQTRELNALKRMSRERAKAEGTLIISGAGIHANPVRDPKAQRRRTRLDLRSGTYD